MLTWVEIKQSAVLHNLRQIKRLLKSQTKLMAVVKSNAYGHGMISMAQLIEKQVDYLGVVNLNEALILRQHKIHCPIFVLTFFDLEPEQIEQAIKKNIELPIYSLAQAKLLSKIARQLDKQIKVHLKVDTGASRIGIFPVEVVNFVKRINVLPNLKLQGIFTHYAAAESMNQEYTNQQKESFRQIIIDLEKNNLCPPLQHTACSAAILTNSQTHFNLVRLGIALYGLWPAKETKQITERQKKKIVLKPALTWKTKIIQIKQLPAGTFISYGLTYKTKKKTTIAVLPVGYWDGYDRRLSNCGEVLIHNQRCPIRGRVCMNLIMVDITHLNNTRVGDTVILLGKEIIIEELANKIGTIAYEIMTRINPLLPRKYC